jgi:hypothetical protein
MLAVPVGTPRAVDGVCAVTIAVATPAVTARPSEAFCAVTTTLATPAPTLAFPVMIPSVAPAHGCMPPRGSSGVSSGSRETIEPSTPRALAVCAVKAVRGVPACAPISLTSVCTDEMTVAVPGSEPSALVAAFDVRVNVELPGRAPRPVDGD